MKTAWFKELQAEQDKADLWRFIMKMQGDKISEEYENYFESTMPEMPPYSLVLGEDKNHYMLYLNGYPIGKLQFAYNVMNNTHGCLFTTIL